MSSLHTNMMLMVQVDWGALRRSIIAVVYKTSFGNTSELLRLRMAICSCVPDLAELPFGTPAWAEQLHDTLEMIEDAAEYAVDAKHISRLLMSAYTRGFDAMNPQKLSRFSSLEEHLLNDLLPARLVEYQRLASQYASKLFQKAAQYLCSNASPSTEAAVFQQLLTGIPKGVVSLLVQVFKECPFDVSGLTLEEDKQVQTERARLNAQLAKLLAARKSLEHISHTAAFIPANKFHLGKYKEPTEASADFPKPSDAEEL